ncbi:MAG: hypothetical protein ABSC17_06975 [Thermacetogeniaceae bacterium]
MGHESLSTILIAFVLQDIPESLVLTMVVFSLLNLRLQYKNILMIALLQALTNQVQLLNIANGIHTIILIISLAIYIRLVTKSLMSKALLAVLISFVILTIVELSYAYPLLRITGLALKTVYDNPFLRSAFALPYEIVLLLVALGKNYYNHKRGLLIEA